MPFKRHSSVGLWGLVIILLCTSLIVGCNSGEAEVTIPGGVRTRLLVEAPSVPLPAGGKINVRSRSEAVKPGVSHVELYAVQLPSGEQNVLIRSDAAPFDQTIFTAMQEFTPVQPGRYVIKVVGYNRLGQKSESEYISFDVE